MNSRVLRRAVLALSLASTLSIVPTGTAEASARRWRDAAPRQERVLEGRSILLDLWSRLVGVLAEAGVHMDGSG